MAHRARSSGRDYPRTARLNELLREILAEALLTVDDGRLEHVSITSVDVDRDLNRAVVRFDTLDANEEDDAAVVAAFGDHRVTLQAAIGQEARVRRTPMLSFRPDEAVRTGERIEGILLGLAPTAGEATEVEATPFEVADAADEAGDHGDGAR